MSEEYGSGGIATGRGAALGIGAAAIGAGEHDDKATARNRGSHLVRGQGRNVRRQRYFLFWRTPARGNAQKHGHSPVRSNKTAVLTGTALERGTGAIRAGERSHDSTASESCSFERASGAQGDRELRKKKASEQQDRTQKESENFRGHSLQGR